MERVATAATEAIIIEVNKRKDKISKKLFCSRFARYIFRSEMDLINRRKVN